MARTAPLWSALRLPAAFAIAAGRAIAANLCGFDLPVPKPKGLAVLPRDARPATPEVGERLLAGVFRFGGETLEVGPGGDPWNRPAPSRRFAAWLHGFGWLGDLMSADEAGADEALRLWLGWRRPFGRFNAFAWSGEPLERRVFNLACAAPRLLAVASDAEGSALLESLARQARRLLRPGEEPSRACERAAAAALAGAALAGSPGEQLLGRALPKLSRALPGAVLPDGVHASRSPERGLELFFDLLALDDALSQRGAPSPPEASRAIDRLGSAAGFFALGGRLASFHGGEAGPARRIAAALALGPGDAPPKGAPYGGYQRIGDATIELIADAGSPAHNAQSLQACAQPGAIEAAVHGRRLIMACAWSTKAPPDAACLRGPLGGSTLSVGDAWPARPLEGASARLLGPRLDGPPIEVRIERRDEDEAIWLDIIHDGWRGAFGLIHTRRLYVDLAAGELRGEDELKAAGRGGRARPEPYAISFHLAPEVSASLAVDRRSALLRPAGEAVWRLRSDAPEMRLEPSAVFEAGEARQTQTVVLAGQVTAARGGRIRWKLSRDDVG
jgi:uncharacterized heparinase superfamily protein